MSCLLLPAPSLGLVLAQKLVAIFHLMDLNQFYTLLFCLWFLLLGVLEYLLLRFYLAALVLAGGLGPREPVAVNAFGYDFLCDKLPAAG